LYNDYEYTNAASYLNKKINSLIDSVKHNPDTTLLSDELRTFIDNMNEFLNLALLIIKHRLSNEKKFNYKYSSYDIVDMLMDNVDNFYNNFDNKLKLTHSKIKLFKTDVDSFYTIESNSDEINLLLTYDGSVKCNKTILYKDIISGKVVDYKYLLNNCEFITPVFLKY